jgi:hypothetical protein
VKLHGPDNLFPAEEGLKEQYAVTDRKVCKQDKVWENAAFVWVHSLPFVRRARIAQLLCAHEEEVHCVAKRRAKCIHDRCASVFCERAAAVLLHAQHSSM